MKIHSKFATDVFEKSTECYEGRLGDNEVLQYAKHLQETASAEELAGGIAVLLFNIKSHGREALRLQCPHHCGRRR